MILLPQRKTVIQAILLLMTIQECCSFFTPTSKQPSYQTIPEIPTTTTTQLLNSNVDQSPAEEKSVGQQILDLSIPTLGALLIDPLLTLIDTAFVGRFATNGSSELAGMGSAAALLTFSFYLCNFLCTATTPLVSKQRASGNEDQALQVGGQALSLALALGLSLTVILLSLQQPLLSLMIGGDTATNGDQTSFAVDFLSYRAIAAPAVLTISASTGILRGYLDTKTPIVILVLANLVNLGLDVGLIAFLKMGPAGAAIATTTAEWMSALLFLGVLSGTLPSADGELGRKSEKETTITVVPTQSIPSWKEIQPLLVASSSLFLRTFVLQLFLSSAAAFAARDPINGSASMSAHQIGLQLWILGSFISDALAAASQALIADGMGRQDVAKIRSVSKTVVGYSLILGLFLALLLSVGTDSVLQVFTTDTDTQEALSQIIPLIVLAQPLNAYVFAADGILQGASEFPFQAKSMALSGAVGALSFVALSMSLDSNNMLVQVWTALIVLQFMRGITSTVKMIDSNGPIQMWK